MSRDGFAFRLAQHVTAAAQKRPSLLRKRVTPHVLRHSCAMHTLAATGDIRKVSLWLGHASLQSTEAYLRVDPAEKLAVLAAHAPPAIQQGRFRSPSDKLLAHAVRSSECNVDHGPRLALLEAHNYAEWITRLRVGKWAAPQICSA